MLQSLIIILLAGLWQAACGDECFGDYFIYRQDHQLSQQGKEACAPDGYFTLKSGWHYLFCGNLQAVDRRISLSPQDSSRYEVTLLLQLPSRNHLENLQVAFNGQPMVLEEVNDCERFNFISLERYVLASYRLKVCCPSEFKITVLAKKTTKLEVRQMDMIQLGKISANHRE